MKSVYQFMVLLFLGVLFAGSVNTHTAQAREMGNSVSNYFSEAEAQAFRERYLRCITEGDIQGKIRISEELGERGAEKLCLEKGWTPLLRKSDKSPNHPQGVDQVWQSSDGIFQVVEAKGITKGDSFHLPENRFGHKEGTPEWVIDALQDTLKSNSASEAEKRIARQALEAARNGDMNIHVIYTQHVLGKPETPIWHSINSCSEEASRMASRVIESPIFKTPVKVLPIHNAAANDNFGSVLCGSFHKEQRIDFSLADRFSRQERLKIAIGINDKTLKKAGTAGKYIQKRGSSTIAGKLFEESYVQKFQREFARNNPEYRLENTALLGKPHDPADLILTRQGIIVEKYQQKLSFGEAVKALRESKYSDCSILVPRDIYKELKHSKSILVQESINSGRLTDRVFNITTETSFAYKAETNCYINSFYRAAKPIEAVLSTMEIINSALDISRGIQLIYTANMDYRAELLDRDIAEIKLFLGSIDIVSGITGISLAFIPGVNLISGIVTGVIGLTVEGGDALLMWIQKKRFENQKELIKKLKGEEQADAICMLILRYIE